jgi:hypothetical protein
MSSSDWDIKGNAGAATCINRRTGETFTGTIAAFNARISGARAFDAVISRNVSPDDIGKTIVCNSSSVITLTLLADDKIFTKNDEEIAMCMYGTGTPVFAAGANVTLRGTPAALAQYGIRTVVRIGPNEWTYKP